MNDALAALGLVLSIILGLIVLYAATRLISAAWHRSKLEAEAEQAAIRAESQHLKEKDNG